MTARPITTSTATTTRQLLLCVLLVIALAPFGGAGDPDDDWGLPSMPASNQTASGGGKGSGGGGAQLTAGGPSAGAQGSGPLAGALEVPLTESAGRLVLHAAGASGAELSAAVVSAIDMGAPLAVELSSGALTLQGAAELQPGLVPALGAPAALHVQAPAAAVHHAAFLVFDDGAPASLADLITSPEGLVHVTALQALGPLASFDATRFQKLVAAHAELLGDTRVSLVVLSLDGDLVPHLTGVRLEPGAAQIEVLAF